MKYKELREIVKYLQNKKFLKNIARVDDNVLRALFEDEEIFFDLNRSKNLIYKRDDFTKTKFYNAPFDKVLAKRCKNAQIERIELDSQDKIVRIFCNKKGSYKEERAVLQLEFTGRHANAIILGEKERVLEALHHDFHRDIRPGKPLIPLAPPKALDRGEFVIEDMDRYLKDIYLQEVQKRLHNLKSAKLLQIAKQKEKLRSHLERLQKEDDLVQEAQKQELYANIILANLHAIKPYQKEFCGYDFEGNKISFPLPSEAKTAAHASEILFTQAKKLRQKAKNIHIERENLLDKIAFLEKKANIIRSAKTIEEVELLFPKQQRRVSKKEKNYEKYFIAGYDVYIGKNKKGNIELLKKARARDIWMHLKDIPSAHVIVATNKQNIPQEVLEQAGRLCAQFSVKHPGKYLVDYTQRRNVKPKEGANVEYVKYKTIPVTIQ